jgi:DNA-binding HxlR family transcriptional regulator
MAIKDMKSEELLAKHSALDENCKDTFFALLVYGGLRHNKIMNALKQLNTKMSRPTLDTHLKHLVESGLVECKTAFQSSEYSLIKDIYELMRPLNMEEIKQHLESEKENEKYLPVGLRRLNISSKEFYANFSDERIDDLVNKDVEYLLVSSILELKELVAYELSLEEFDNDDVFWKLVGNPMYRMHEKSIAKKCRDCPHYKEKLFSKIEAMRTEFDNKYNKRPKTKSKVP